MKPIHVLVLIVSYFLLLMCISWLTSKKDKASDFFTGGNSSPWFLVAFGMIGASLSGVTFISVPGWVASSKFFYMQMVLGYFLGYIVVAYVLLPIYYRMNLTSIYTYLGVRFGKFSHLTGASFFLLSRIIGASFRLFLVANVLQILMFDAWGIPFYITVFVTIALIWLYTFRGGIKTIVWTDTLQTLFMLIAVGVAIYILSDKITLDNGSIIDTIRNSSYSTIFDWDWRSKSFFVKQFLSGMFITIVMTGLDQDMMQKNLTCRSIGDAKKNMLWFSIVLIGVNLVFLSLGALLYIYANQNTIDIPKSADNLFPIIATEYLGFGAGIFFILGLIAAAYSSADSALTSLTTSFCVDILGWKDEQTMKEKKAHRYAVHLGMSVALFMVILIFHLINDESVISSLFKAAGYTYGPLLGLFAYGIFTKFQVIDKLVPVFGILSPIITYIIGSNSKKWFGGYEFGFELLIVNGLLTFVLLLSSSLLINLRK